MSKDKKNVPKIRFPGFTDPWEERKLGKLAEFSKGNGYTKNDLKESGTPIILYGRLYTKYETIINDVDTFVDMKEKSVISEGNEVLVPASGETAEDISRASVVGKSGFILGGDLNIIKPKHEIDPTFLALTISNGTQQKEMTKRAQGKSVVHLHNSDLKQVNLFYPKLEEQKQIGNFFIAIDHLITLHQRKLNNIQNLKAGLLQKMFPKNGEVFPEVRFPGFTEPWEQCKFGDILKNHAFRPYLAEANEVGTYKVIQQGDKSIIGYADGEPFINFDAVSLFGDHTVSLYKPTEPFFVATDGVKILSAEGFDGKYLYTLLECYKPESQGYKRHFTILKNKDAWVTKNSHEQAKIGQFFESLDHLITLHHRKLEHLQEQKKSLLQDMFV